MKKWYGVTTSFYNDGRTTAAITSIIDAEEKPEDSYRSGPRADVYIDWFDSYTAAEKFVNDARKA